MTTRSNRGRLATGLGVMLAFGATLTGGTADGQQFRVENRVFEGNDDVPLVESTTIFHDGVVYDYLKAPPEITVFDAVRGQFVLLDQRRQIQTRLTTDQVADLVARLKRWAADQSDPFLQFLADPTFEEQFDENTQELTFASPWITYRLATVDAPGKAISRPYREFSDWYCRLNTFLNPGSKPPFARLLVNASLAQRQKFPREVHLTLRPKGGRLSKQMTSRSEHRLVPRLVEPDRNRIRQTDQFMAMFRALDFDEYQKTVCE